jgi:hypothetical protein
VARRQKPYVDLAEEGIIDATEVAEVALENAVSVARTEARVCAVPRIAHREFERTANGVGSRCIDAA